MKNPAPLQTAWPDGATPPAWANWFQQVFAGLSGWATSSTTTRSFDFPSIPAHSEATALFSVSGARSGATVLVSPSINTAGVIYQAVVTANDVITLYAKNFTAGSIDPADTSFVLIILQN